MSSTDSAQCKTLLDAGTDINYDGAAGPLDFSSAGEPSVGTYDVWHFDSKGAVVTDKQTVITPSS